jgi:hypothetical protein
MKLIMIDKYLYKFFGLIDDLFMKVEEVLTFNWPNSKKKKKK